MIAGGTLTLTVNSYLFNSKCIILISFHALVVLESHVTFIERFDPDLFPVLLFYYSDGPHLRKVNNKDTFCEHPLKGTDVAFKAARGKLITDLTAALENRFSDTTRGIFQATHLAKISSWPNAKEVQELESTITNFVFF